MIVVWSTLFSIHRSVLSNFRCVWFTVKEVQIGFIIEIIFLGHKENYRKSFE